MKAHRVDIHDGATVKCNHYDVKLSEILLLKNNLTFYQKFGFDFNPDDNNIFTGPGKNLKFKVNDILNDI